MNETKTKQELFINFMSPIDDKSSSALLYVISDYLKTGIKNIHINISSGGGSVFSAITIYNFLKGIKDVQIHTHNFGQVDSSANVIFLSGQIRTCSSAASFILHSVKMIFQNNSLLSSNELNERQESLKMDTEKIATIIALSTQKTVEEVLKDIEKSLVLNAEKAKDYGLVHDIIDFTIKPGQPVVVITNQK